MSSDRDVTRTVRSWLEEGATSLPDRVLDEVLDQLPATPQRRAWWPAWRIQQMNTPLKVAFATAAIGLFAVVGLSLTPRSEGPGAQVAAPSPSPSPVPLHPGSLAAGTYTVLPFALPGSQQGALCMIPAQTGCEETTADDGIRVTVTVPEGWVGVETAVAKPTWAPPDGAWLMFQRGGWLFSDPCADAVAPDIPVGPSVADFVTALVDHPGLDVTEPVPVTLDGYDGTYLELQPPSDTTACPYFFAYAPGIYAQSSDELWQLWVLDVDGLRVVVRADTYAETSPQVRQELEGIVDSLRIDVPLAEIPTASPTPSS